MALKPITEADYRRAVDEHPYYAGRWGYYRLALGFAGCPESVVELGPHRLPLFPAGDTMDVNPALAPTYRHDARVLPWPVEDGRYDLFVALQVWEHLGASQAIAFREVMRVAKRAILSFPFTWDCPDDPVHHAIGREKIREWTCGIPWRALVFSPDGLRAVCYWEF